MRSPGSDRLTTVAIYGVALAAAAASFASLQDLARLIGFSIRLALVLPVAIDLYAFAATRTWLDPQVHSARVRRMAQRSAWFGIAVSIAGNALDHLLRAGTWPTSRTDDSWPTRP